MKHVLLLLCICLGLALKSSGQEAIQSNIVDENGVGIPFASIGITQKNFGAVTFEDGSFSLISNQAYFGDTLIVSAVGYKRRKIAYEKFVSQKPKSISLKEEITFLSEVVISPEQLSFHELGMKKNSSPNHLGISSPLNGATVAILIEDVTEPVLIDEITVTIRQLNMASVQVRCRIYGVHPETGFPGEDLLKENLILTSSETQQRLIFKPSNDLWIDQPFYVGFEWVTTKNQFERLQRAKDAFPLDFIDEIVAQNSGYSFNVNENKRVQFRDSEGTLVKKVNLTKEQTAILNEKDAASPKLQFKIKVKGTRTFTGSPITGKWSKSPHEALISIKVGRRKNSNEEASESNEGEYLHFGDNKIRMADLDLFLDKQMAEQDIPGISLVVFNKDEILHHATKGFADIENNIPVSENTIFEAASLSKPLFAYFIMKYVDVGLLDLDRPLHEYLPYEDIEFDERYKRITARMILSHTSGFPNWRTDHEGKLFISFEPGTNYQYSGEGFQYLAKVLAHLLNTNDLGLEQAYQKEVAKPLGLETTKFLQDMNNLTNKAQPHKDGERVKGKYKNDTFGAAFSVHSEAKDFSIWLRALLNEDGLSKASFLELFKTQVTLAESTDNLSGASAWTLGFGKYDLDDATFFGHGGNNYGYTSGFFIDKERNLGAIIFTNADQVSDFVIDTFLFLNDLE